MRKYILVLALVAPTAQALTYEQVCDYYAAEAGEIMSGRQQQISKENALRMTENDVLKQAIVEDAYKQPVYTHVDDRLSALFDFHDDIFDMCMDLMEEHYGGEDE